MKLFRTAVTVAAASLSFMIVSCAKEPAQEIAGAQAAVAAAKIAQADKYVSKEFAMLEDSLKAALTEVQKQRSSNPLSRSFDKAKASLVSISATAATLKASAETEKAKVQAEAESALAILDSATVQAKDLVTKLPKKGKEVKTLFEAKGKEIEAVAAKTADIKALEKSGDLIAARDAANSAIASILAIKTDLTSAIERAAPKAKKSK